MELTPCLQYVDDDDTDDEDDDMSYISLTESTTNHHINTVL